MMGFLGIDDFSDEELALSRALVEADEQYRSDLRLAREEAGLTQEQVAESLGISKQAVQKLEAPDANPKMSTLRQYASAIGARVTHTVTSNVAPPAVIHSGLLRVAIATVEDEVDGLWEAAPPARQFKTAVSL